MKDKAVGIASNQSIDELLGLIVHTYNNYFAGINGFTELAMLHSGDEKAEEMLSLSLHSGENAAHFGKTLLASIERLQVNNTSIKAEKLFRSIKSFSIQSNTEPYNNFHIRINTEWFSECAGEVVEFLNNLSSVLELDNSLSISVTNNEHLVLKISFSIAGVTLTSEQQTNLFDIFFSSKKMFNRPGVGLAKVKGYLGQVGGKVSWVEQQGIEIDLPVLG